MKSETKTLSFENHNNGLWRIQCRCCLGLQRFVDVVDNEFLLNLLQSDTDSLSEEEQETQEDKKIQRVRREVQMFFTGPPPIAKKDHPLSWWRENEGRFPTLSTLARSLLCIPATSTPSERIFSAAGNICSQKRASLTRDHVDMLTFLSMNKLNDMAWASLNLILNLVCPPWQVSRLYHKVHVNNLNLDNSECFIFSCVSNTVRFQAVEN